MQLLTSKYNGSIEPEPGLINAFRYVVIIFLLGQTLALLDAFIFHTSIEPEPFRHSVIWILAILLLIYLSVPGVNKLIQKIYLPIGIHFATAIILVNAVFPSSDLMTEGINIWQTFIFLIFPLILTSWQYRIRHVILFTVLTGFIEILMRLVFTPDYFLNMQIGGLAIGVIFLRSITFLVLGNMIVILMNTKRSQEMRLIDAHERIEMMNEELVSMNQSLEVKCDLLSESNGELESLNEELEERVRERTREILDTYENTLHALVRALEFRDIETKGHCDRVSKLTVGLATKLGVLKNEMPNIYRGAILHDIGKISVHDSILLKPGSLNDEEWLEMKRHTEFGYEYIKDIDFLRESTDIVRYHHEKWDGSGYPFGLKAEDIPLPARIFAIIDVWDALTSDRPYRKAWSREKALDFIVSESGKHFDPAVVKDFLEMITASDSEPDAQPILTAAAAD